MRAELGGETTTLARTMGVTNSPTCGIFFKSFMAIACTSFVVAISAQAQEFPSKNVTLMMPYAAGGPDFQPATSVISSRM